MLQIIGVGDGGRGARASPQNSGKYFSGNYNVNKIRAFSGKNHVKFGNFVNCLGKYHKNSGIFIIFQTRNPE